MAKIQTAQNMKFDKVGTQTEGIVLKKIIIQPETTKPEFGVVITMVDGIAIVGGLPNVKVGELVTLSNVKGLALNLNKDTVGIAIFGDDNKVFGRDIVKRTNEIIKIPVGPWLQGRILSALGACIDSGVQLTEFKDIPYSMIEVKVPGIIDRQSVNEPLQNGILSIALDTIINQKQKGEYHASKQIFCFYVAIGEKRSTVAQLPERLRIEGALIYTTIVAATALESTVLQYLAPYIGAAVGELYRDRGQYALIIYDDLTKQTIVIQWKFSVIISLKYYLFSNKQISYKKFLFTQIIQLWHWIPNEKIKLSWFGSMMEINKQIKLETLKTLANKYQCFLEKPLLFILTFFFNFIKNILLNILTFSWYSKIKITNSIITYFKIIKTHKNKKKLKIPGLILSNMFIIKLSGQQSYEIKELLPKIEGRMHAASDTSTKQVLGKLNLVFKNWIKCGSLNTNFCQNNNYYFRAEQWKNPNNYVIEQVGPTKYKQLLPHFFTHNHPVAQLQTLDRDNSLILKFTAKPLLSEKSNAVRIPALTKMYNKQQFLIPEPTTFWNEKLKPITENILADESNLYLICNSSINGLIDSSNKILTLSDQEILFSSKFNVFEFGNNIELSEHMKLMEVGGNTTTLVTDFIE